MFQRVVDAVQDAWWWVSDRVIDAAHWLRDHSRIPLGGLVVVLACALLFAGAQLWSDHEPTTPSEETPQAEENAPRAGLSRTPQQELQAQGPCGDVLKEFRALMARQVSGARLDNAQADQVTTLLGRLNSSCTQDQVELFQQGELDTWLHYRVPGS